MLLDTPFFMSAKCWNIHYMCPPACSSAAEGGFLYTTHCSKWYWLLTSGTVAQWHQWPHLAHPKSIPSEMKCLNALQGGSNSTSPHLFPTAVLKGCVCWAMQRLLHVLPQCPVSSLCACTHSDTCWWENSNELVFFFCLFHRGCSININVLHNICFQRQEHF